MSNSVSPTLPLADLHLPTAPGFFPLAWGWWLIIALGLIILFFSIYRLYKRIKKKRAQKIALRALQHCQSIAEINLLLKRTALSYYAKDEVASLTSGAWLRFLDDKLPIKERGFTDIEQIWLEATFGNKAVNSQTLTSAKILAEKWLKKGLTYV